MKLTGDPVYAVAKAYALRSQLLPFPVIEELADSKSLTEFVERLRASPYGPYLGQLQKPYTAIELEKAFWRHLITEHHSLAETSLTPQLLRQYFMRYVYSNVKTILKGKALGKPVDDIMKSIDLYAETLLGVRDQALRALGAKTLTEAVKEFTKTELASAVSTAINLWETKRDYSAVDAVVDKMYLEGLLHAYRETPASQRKEMTPFVSMDVDGYALTTVLRSRVWGLMPVQAKDFLPSQTIMIGREALDILLTAEDLGKALEDLPKPEFLSKISLEGSPSTLAAQIEENVKRNKLRYASKSFYKTPFKQAVLISYVILKEAEVKNLATIAKNIEEGVTDPNVIQRLLLNY
ncbi:MAG: V-type ATPase subunit [Candidatus Caldarchaeum sp.]